MSVKLQKGFSLVELMVALLMGTLVIVGVTQVFAASVRANNEAVSFVNLNQQLRAVMSIVTRELKRAGNYGDALDDLYVGAQNNPFVSVAVLDSTGDGVNDCVVFGYDENADGLQDATEWKSFRRSDSGIMMDAGDAFSAASCDLSGVVGELVDTSSVQITNLSFDLTTLLSPSAAPVCTADMVGDRLLQARVRTVAVTLAGQLANDATVTRQLSQRVRIRADEIIGCECQANLSCT